MSDPQLVSVSGAPPSDYADNGVDLSLIRWSISLTPLERLISAEELINEVLAIRERNAAR